MSPAKDYEAGLKELIGDVLREQASDLHISAGHHPTLRIAGRLTPLVKKQVLTPEDTQGFVFAMLDDQKRSKLLSERELDFSYNFEAKARFRVNAYFER
ncbi:MAG: type IV pili twitching motility protein PilT, partial [Patescibacteria group bacterium]